MKFMTFNIRMDSAGEAYAPAPPLPSTFEGELPWSVRKWKVGDSVLLWEPDIVGFQVKVVVFFFASIYIYIQKDTVGAVLSSSGGFGRHAG